MKTTPKSPFRWEKLQPYPFSFATAATTISMRL